MQIDLPTSATSDFYVLLLDFSTRNAEFANITYYAKFKGAKVLGIIPGGSASELHGSLTEDETAFTGKVISKIQFAHPYRGSITGRIAEPRDEVSWTFTPPEDEPEPGGILRSSHRTVAILQVPKGTQSIGVELSGSGSILGPFGIQVAGTPSTTSQIALPGADATP
jgi:hypothetical protein